MNVPTPIALLESFLPVEVNFGMEISQSCAAFKLLQVSYQNGTSTSSQQETFRLKRPTP